VIKADHPNYDEIHTIDDLDQFHPGFIPKLLDWLINYKTTEGKEPNELKNEKPCSVQEAKVIINGTHHFYKDLVARKENDDHGYCLE
jgi:inorganic pyrophosphatase